MACEPTETPKAPITFKQAGDGWRGLTQLGEVIFGFVFDAEGQVRTIKRRLTGDASGSGQGVSDPAVRVEGVNAGIDYRPICEHPDLGVRRLR